jgi:hypothetical protein
MEELSRAMPGGGLTREKKGPAMLACRGATGELRPANGEWWPHKRMEWAGKTASPQIQGQRCGVQLRHHAPQHHWRHGEVPVLEKDEVLVQHLAAAAAAARWRRSAVSRS